MADLVTVRASAPAEAETVLGAAGLTPDRWSAGPGTWFGGHTHPRHKVLFCVEGAITFVVEGRRWPMGPGDRLDLPAGVRHEAQAGPAGVTCVEAYLPDGDPPA